MKQNFLKYLLILISIISISLSLYLFLGYKSKYYGLQVSKSVEYFSLLDHDGNLFTADRLKNKNSLIFFGYTKCYTVCPVSMKILERILEKIESKNLQVLYISIDPTRDDLESLKKYSKAFDRRFIGLRGSNEAIRTVAQQFNVQISNIIFGDESNPQFEHTGNIYFVDNKAMIKSIYPMGFNDIDRIVKDILSFMKVS